MAKSISADKRENEKKRLARRAEQKKKKEEKKLSNKANSFEDMIAYVDTVSYTHLGYPEGSGEAGRCSVQGIRCSA